ncbi:hypothetical protein [Geothrix limicola]|uniref:hypothetical protein n=1 Tax=Geothrix limicola TaxID=2927978 RepID=UPI002554AF19|nr:hypothetical protein [Geothrix limicola]
MVHPFLKGLQMGILFNGLKLHIKALMVLRRGKESEIESAKMDLASAHDMMLKGITQAESEWDQFDKDAYDWIKDREIFEEIPLRNIAPGARCKLSWCIIGSNPTEDLAAHPGKDAAGWYLEQQVDSKIRWAKVEDWGTGECYASFYRGNIDEVASD